MDLTDKLYKAAGAIQRGVSRVMDGNPFAQINLIERTDKHGMWNVVEIDLEVPENFHGDDSAMKGFARNWLNAALLQMQSAHNAEERVFEVTVNKATGLVTIETQLLDHEVSAIIAGMDSFDACKRRRGKEESIIRGFDCDSI